MIIIIDKLLELQNLLSGSKPLPPAAKTQEESLRAQVPKPILVHFDRLIAQGKTGVAVVRHGVCGGCHLSISSGTAAGLARHDDIHICGNCGRYLCLAPEGTEPQPAGPPPAKRRPSRKSGRQMLVLA